MSDLVCVKTFSGRLEAEIAKGMLEAHGIKAMVAADDAGGFRPELAFSFGVRLLVLEGNAEQALSLIEASEGAGLPGSEDQRDDLSW